MSITKRVDALRKRIEEFKTPRQRSKILASDAKLKAEVKSVYKGLFNKELTGCVDCLADGLFEILNLNGKRMTQLIERRFWLKAGAVIHDKNFNAEKMMSNVNITDELALYHLSRNPDCAKHFRIIPDNWRELISESENKTATSGTPKEPAQRKKYEKRNRL